MVGCMPYIPNLLKFVEATESCFCSTSKVKLQYVTKHMTLSSNCQSGNSEASVWDDSLQQYTYTQNIIWCDTKTYQIYCKSGKIAVLAAHPTPPNLEDVVLFLLFQLGGYTFPACYQIVPQVCIPTKLSACYSSLVHLQLIGDHPIPPDIPPAHDQVVGSAGS